jgi:hypothetical protein
LLSTRPDTRIPARLRFRDRNFLSVDEQFYGRYGLRIGPFDSWRRNETAKSDERTNSSRSGLRCLIESVFLLVRQVLELLGAPKHHQIPVVFRALPASVLKCRMVIQKFYYWGPWFAGYPSWHNPDGCASGRMRLRLSPYSAGRSPVTCETSLPSGRAARVDSRRGLRSFLTLGPITISSRRSVPPSLGPLIITRPASRLPDRGDGFATKPGRYGGGR